MSNAWISLTAWLAQFLGAVEWFSHGKGNHAGAQIRLGDNGRSVYPNCSNYFDRARYAVLSFCSGVAGARNPRLPTVALRYYSAILRTKECDPWIRSRRKYLRLFSGEWNARFFHILQLYRML